MCSSNDLQEVVTWCLDCRLQRISYVLIRCAFLTGRKRQSSSIAKLCRSVVHSRGSITASASQRGCSSDWTRWVATSAPSPRTRDNEAPYISNGSSSLIVFLLYFAEIITLLVVETNRYFHDQLIVYYRDYKAMPMASILSHINPINALAFCFYKIHFSIMILFGRSFSKSHLTFRFSKSHITFRFSKSHLTFRFSKSHLTLRFPHQNPVCTSPLPHTCHMPCPSHSSWSCYPNNVGREVQIAKLLTTYSSRLLVFLVPLRPKYPTQHPVL
jgi:hypothetical protein